MKVWRVVVDSYGSTIRGKWDLFTDEHRARWVADSINRLGGLAHVECAAVGQWKRVSS